MVNPNELTDAEVLARTMYGEARGEGIDGLRAIAHVVLNRANYSNHKHWWGGTVKEVCLKPYQFSCWNKNDPNYKTLTKDVLENPCMVYCRWHAILLLDACRNCSSEDNTKGATHYHTQNVFPKWAIGKIPCVKIKNHMFYNDIEKEN